MYKIIEEDECNDTYGRYRMHKALELKKEAKDGDFPHIPCERTVYRIMERLGIVHTPKRKPNGITKADREAMKSDDKIKRDFTSERPLEKAVTDITEIQTADGRGQEHNMAIFHELLE
jgi:putative transposase